MPPIKSRTYIFAGHDIPASWTACYEGRDDCVVIHAVTGESIEDAVARANIQAPANLYLDCHGSRKGTFTWNNAEADTGYDRFFRALPRQGIGLVTIGSCFGAKAMDHLAALPPGTILQTLVGSASLSEVHQFLPFTRETAGLSNPATIIIEALENFHPREFRQSARAENKRFGLDTDTRPGKALPIQIGIGGERATRVPFAGELSTLQTAARQSTLDLEAWDRSVARVLLHFDARTLKKGSYDTTAYDAQAQHRLTDEIGSVANRILRHRFHPDLSTADGVGQARIAYALAVAYWDESGAMDKQIALARIPSARLQAPALMPPAPAAPAFVDFPLWAEERNEALKTKYLALLEGSAQAQGQAFDRSREETRLNSVLEKLRAAAIPFAPAPSDESAGPVAVERNLEALIRGAGQGMVGKKSASAHEHR